MASSESEIRPNATMSMARSRSSLIEGFAERAVAIEQQRSELVQLHLFGVLVVGENVFEVHELARLGRSPIAQAKCFVGEAHLGHGCGNGGEQKRRHRPTTEAKKQRRVAEQRNDGILQDLEAASRPPTAVVTTPHDALW